MEMKNIYPPERQLTRMNMFLQYRMVRNLLDPVLQFKLIELEVGRGWIRNLTKSFSKYSSIAGET